MSGLADVTLHYAATGLSKHTDELGMRAMQRRVWDVRDARYILVKSPPASGKSRAAMFIALDKLRNQNLSKVVVAVPERSIGASFRDMKLSADGFFADWELDRDLCGVGSETGSKVRELVDFLSSGSETTVLCTHATLRFAFAAAGLEAFDGCLVCIDELHHASNDEDNRLGNFLRGLMDRGSAHILAMTGSYFRGDGEAILHPEDEARFEKVIYTYYEQLNGYEFLKELHIGFRFYQGRYLDAIGEALDPQLKTIIHIPHVGSSEAAIDKMFAVDAIISSLGEPLGQDPATGFERVRAGRRVLKVANLVDDSPGRERIMASLRNVRQRQDVDIIVALGMAKEGFDWIWCEHVLTVGYRGSLTEIVQIIGRATRDAPGKISARFTNLVSAPFANDDTVARAVNDMLKAISVSLLMEQVMAPVFRFRTFKGADEFDGTASRSKREPVTNMGEIEVVGVPPVDPEAARIIETDFPDLFADVQSDPRTITVMINPDDHHADVIYDMVVTDVIRNRYPRFSDEQLEDAINLFGIRSGLARAVSEEPDSVHVVSGNQLPLLGDPLQETGPSQGERPAEGALTGGDRFVRDTRRFIDVRELNVDLLGNRREFDDAYELLSKALNEEVLVRLHGEVRAMKVPMTQEEAEKLYPRVREFIDREGREPNLNSPNGREVRLADALAVLRRLARQRRADMSGADGEGTESAGTTNV
ncbi:superfamily II DNA or RNA helicase [Bradyrhizobium elkanii]|uniref:DEAD/DEAH box helicase n=1 Tax=Bradyrhizobium elkanii TaxID=29448 RepID=UPI0021696A20|nr:DEAD/DEAH box helicase [Bradyrhizobium elkanii]MCS3687518.1 hypothetical protein [Bradyrhizobium elkanii]